MSKNKAKSLATLHSYFFITPNFIGFMAFTFLPVIASLLLSFYEWDIITWPPKFIGFENFKALMNDKQFWKYSWNTMVLMSGIPVTIFGSLALAIFVNKKIRGITFFKTIFFLPSITAGVAIYLLWQWIYNPDFGLLNWFLTNIGVIKGPNWLQDVTWAKPSLILMGWWASIGGGNMILYLASLQGIDTQIYEAADIDGANAWQKFIKVTWPLVGPTTFFIFVMEIIGGFQGGFNTAYIMTQGGPAGSTTTVSYYIFNNAYAWLKMGYAAAIAWFLFIVILVITLFNWIKTQKQVHYQ